MDVNVEAWESRHWAAYGCGAWERACHQAGLLVAWHEEQGLLLGAPPPRRFSAHPAPRAKWPWGSRRHNVGLLLWRAAHDAGILVDQVPLADTMRYYDPGTHPLASGPVPDAARTSGLGIGSAESMAGVKPVLQAHITADLPRPRPAGVRPTLGYRVRELRATPDWEGGDWPTALVLVREATRRADDLRQQGTWQPTARERSTGTRTGLDRELTARHTTPGNPAPSWLARASHLVDLTAALSGDADTLPCDSLGNPGPLAEVLTTTARACAWLQPSTGEIERLWAAEPRPPADPASWEPHHVPEALRAQTEETEDLVRATAVFLWILACS
ncbi:hypothetical protein ACFV0T_00245 [Streptomyces sp. NPDC059582]|uniref:hypothetical protein n=1 Tax=Streptomyces sp. NPDC059582 TaxID=3346875 RepID=UPI0036C7AD20